MDKVLAVIMAGGAGERLSILCEQRAKPAVPFGGMYRIIDFTLSSCVNSGIHKVAVLTQYNPMSLSEHIGTGRAWDLDRAGARLVLLHPYMSRDRCEWYQGNANAVYQNLRYIEELKPEQALILAGDHVYTMRYDLMIEAHRAHGADVTVGLTEVPQSDVSRFGMITLDSKERVVNFQEKPAVAQSNLGSMGIYVFNSKVLYNCLEANSTEKGHDFGQDIVPKLIGKQKVYGYRFGGYWRDVGTVDAYWQASMDLIVDLPDFDLYDPDTMVYTSSKFGPPVKTGPLASITRSLVCPGCIINGEVRNSVLSPGVYVESGAKVFDSVLFHDAFVSSGAVVERCIVDKEVEIGAGCHIGYGDDYTPNHDEPDHLNSGISLVGKKAVVPAGTNIGRNCKIYGAVDSEDYPSNFIPSGSTVQRRKPPRFKF